MKAMGEKGDTDKRLLYFIVLTILFILLLVLFYSVAKDMILSVVLGT
jgi:hypothetical protein